MSTIDQPLIVLPSGDGVEVDAKDPYPMFPEDCKDVTTVATKIEVRPSRAGVRLALTDTECRTAA
jgi:hypothetical protein